MVEGKKPVKYKIKCISCRQEFVVNSMIDFVPKHPREDDEKLTCTGSGMTGMLMGPVSDERATG